MKTRQAIKRMLCSRIHRIASVAVISVTFAAHAYADNRSFAQAQQIAMQKALSLGANIGEQQLQQAKRFRQSRQKTAADESMPYYIFNFDNKQGYAIVGGDDSMPDIVGYSTQGQLSTDSMPDNMKSFLKAYELTVKAVKQGDEEAVRNVQAAMKRQKGEFTPVEPLLGDIAWDQSKPYNNLCPAYSGDTHSVTGCVATAMAQIMRYWKYPSALQNDIPAYTSYSYQVNVPAIPAGTIYDWDNMIPNYYNSTYNDTQATAVATLMYHVGAALMTDYGPQSGAGLLTSALTDYFGYDKDLINHFWRQNFQWADWNRMLQNELANGRPVLYGGGETEGHAFVCDGIDSDGYYHINWGWGGVSDDYFDITILNPSYPRGEADKDDIRFASCSDMMIGIVPADATDKQPTYECDNLFCSGVSIEVDSYTRSSKDECFSGTVTFMLSNKGKEKERLFSVGLKTSEGELIPIATEHKTLNIPKLQTSEQTIVTLNYSYAIPHGEYDICAIESADGGQTWVLCNGNGTHFYVTDTQWIDKDKRYTEFSSDGLQYQWDRYEDNVYPYMEEFDVRGDVVIPSSIAYNGKTYPITKIGDMCFLKNSYITSVVVPEGVTELGMYCFAGCPELTDVKLPGTLRIIGEWAFASNKKLAEISIPEGVEEIKDYAFQFCYNLKRIDIPEGTKELGKRCIAYCNSLQEITLPSTLQKMGEGCFIANRELVRVTIPESNKNITAFPAECFSNCIKLEGINIPSSVRELGESCFFYCNSLKGTITIPEGVTELPEACFGDCSSLEGINIPSSVRKLGRNCFIDCESLKGTITIPEGVTEIPQGCFCDCYKLEGVTVPSSVRKLGLACFQYCKSLTSVTIPNSVTSIGEYAFSYCKSLKGKITIPEGVTEIPDYCFDGCNSLDSITIPSSVRELGKSCFDCCVNLKGTITIPEGVTEIPDYCFYGCSSLDSITIPSSVRELGKSCFRCCENLKGTITIPEGVTEIPERCFGICQKLEGVTIPSCVRELGKFCFMSCKNLKGTITIPEGVTEIPEWCFYGCQQLQKLILPSTIEEFDSTSLVYNGAKKVVLKAKNVPAGFHSAFCLWANHYKLQEDGTEIFVGRLLDEYPMSQATLYVPDESVDAYKAEVGDMFYAVEPLSTSGIKGTSMSGCRVAVNGRNIAFSGLPAGSVIKIYSIDGRLLAVCTVSTSGVATCSCQEPVVIVKIGNDTMKIATGR